jgi:hypothetical protein
MYLGSIVQLLTWTVAPTPVSMLCLPSSYIMFSRAKHMCPNQAYPFCCHLAQCSRAWILR